MEFFSEAYIPQIQLIFASQRVHASCWHSAHYFNICTKKTKTEREREKNLSNYVPLWSMVSIEALVFHFIMLLSFLNIQPTECITEK